MKDAKISWNATLNPDGTVTVYLTINNRTESMTLVPGEATVTPAKTKKGKASKSVSGTDVPVDNDSLPKTKRKYLGPNGKMLSYARARQLGLV